MRRKFAFGLGFAGILTGAGAVVAQFAADRAPTPPAAPVLPVSPATPVAPPAPPSALPVPTRPAGDAPAAPATSPALPPGVRPASPGGAYVPPTGGIGGSPTGFEVSNRWGTTNLTPVGDRQPPAAPPPVDDEIRSALGPDHPWAVKPEHGAYFICVKSYSRPSRPTPEDTGPSARALAEELATEIRDLYRVQAFLYEYVSEERKAEVAAIRAARERARIFAGQLDKYRQEAQLKGMTFLEEEGGRIRVHYKTVNYREQIAVLVGGFATDEAARKALDTVRTWAAPKNKNLMDGAAAIQTGKDGKQMLGEWHLNPYLTAHVVPNPSVARAEPAAAAGLDPFIVRLNEGRPYSLLKATKGWTLAVKSFGAPVELVSKDVTPSGGGLLRKPGGSKESDVRQLKAGAEQAEALAAALRDMKDAKGNSLGLEAFVLHTRSSSLVTIGQFDSPNDPELLQKRQLLSTMTVKVTEDRTGVKPVTNAPALFGNVMPVPIPRAQ